MFFVLCIPPLPPWALLSLCSPRPFDFFSLGPFLNYSLGPFLALLSFPFHPSLHLSPLPPPPLSTSLCPFPSPSISPPPHRSPYHNPYPYPYPYPYANEISFPPFQNSFRDKKKPLVHTCKLRSTKYSIMHTYILRDGGRREGGRSKCWGREAGGGRREKGE